MARERSVASTHRAACREVASHSGARPRGMHAAKCSRRRHVTLSWTRRRERSPSSPSTGLPERSRRRRPHLEGALRSLATPDRRRRPSSSVKRFVVARALRLSTRSQSRPLWKEARRTSPCLSLLSAGCCGRCGRFGGGRRSCPRSRAFARARAGPRCGAGTRTLLLQSGRCANNHRRFPRARSRAAHRRT